MKSTRLLALAALAALPFTATAASAAPAGPNTGNALSQIDTRAHVIDVRRGGGGGGGGGFAMRGGGGGGFGMRGGGGFRGGAMRGGSFRGGSFYRGGGGPRVGMRYGGPRVAGFRTRAPGYAFRGGRHWRGDRGHFDHRHGHRRFFPVVVGAPYFYDYGPDYYYDDAYYDDAGYGYDNDAVARCAARYRSFDAASGTFLHVSGERRRCPYL